MKKVAVIISLTMILSTASFAQTPLTAYANKNGFVLVNTLTCNQLANTYQEDAEWLIIWYSGWYNGLAKKSAVNVPRVRKGISAVIRYCQANRNKKVIQALDVMFKEEREKK